MIDSDFLNKLVQQIENSNKKTIEEANQKQTRDINEQIKKEIAEVTKNFEEKLKQNNDQHEGKYRELKIKYEKLDKERRKNHIIIFGLEFESGNLANFVVDTLNGILEINLKISDIDDVYTIGKQNKTKPIIVKLTSYLKKQLIFKNCRKLKGTAISIGEELTLEEQKENKILRQHLNRAKQQKLNAVIKNRKLIVNGQEYTAQELEILEESDIEENDKQTEKENVIEIENEVVHIPKSNSAPPTPTKSIQDIEKENLTEELNETRRGGKQNTNATKVVTPQTPNTRSKGLLDQNKEIKYSTAITGENRSLRHKIIKK